MMPQISFYARLEYCTKKGCRTPKYKIVSSAGYYPPMETQKNKKGEVCLYLLEKQKDGEDIPPLRLEFQNSSLNFTGLKDYFIDGKISGFAYGYPFGDKTYSKDKTPNPFYDYRDDGYLFIIHQTDQPTPTAIELLILKDARVLIANYCKQLRMGGFDVELRLLRMQAEESLV